MPPGVSSLDSFLGKLPLQPGIYLMKNDKGKIIYIGAATNLKKRVSSYFKKDPVDPKTRRLVSEIKSIDYEIHESEEAALLHERELIRIHSPRYNYRFSDDKEYPMIQITRPSADEPFSRIFIVRSVSNPHDWFFGRKTDVKALRASVRSLRKIFPVANKSYCFRTKKECLDYSIQRCTAPCVGKISIEEYQMIVNQFVLFLQGKRKDLLEVLYQNMDRASEGLNFELAAKIRDRIAQIETIIDFQKGFPHPRDKDVIFLLEEDNHYMLVVLWLQNAVIIHTETRYLGILETLPESEIIRTFINQYYFRTDFIPRKIEISTLLEDEIETLEIWLSKKQGENVRVTYEPSLLTNPLLQKQIKRCKLDLGEEVRLTLKRDQFKQMALSELQNYLNLPTLPRRIETFDISNIQGTLPVGSMVVFQNGLPLKSEYRRFKIKTGESKPNDVAMLREVVTRRLRRDDPQFASSLPDLLLIDGGKPQVNAIHNVLSQFKNNIPVIGLAKREEKVFIPKKKFPTPIPLDSPALQLLMQCRDEAHRFAISYHQKRRALQPKSQLDQIPGVGYKRRNKLLQHFGDLNRIKEASADELSEVDGISRSLAEKIYLFFKTND
ncbi:MAG: excinuclease ABC subunit UvrC [Candidatus Heimdallarchaeota archaeon]|nr:MAG: excinuclease ABC subunit UvrC [Candidatus Heimdallarchaeota archaeon]